MASPVIRMIFATFSTLLLVPISLAATAKTAPTSHQNVVCLVEEPSDSLQDELYLSCNTTGVVHVTSVIHGYQEEVLDSKTCALHTDAQCSVTDAGFLHQVLTECMGNRGCHVPVSRVFLEECEKNSNYVQVEYECVPDNTVEPDNIVDICGEMLQGVPVSRESGYIKTPGYPDVYSPDVSCSCNLTALDTHATIILTLLDIQLEDDHDCSWDWLEYSTPHDGWGRGMKICQSDHGSYTEFTTNKTVMLNFRADNKVEDRGFWLRYEGRHATGGGAEVLIDCKNYQPNIVRKVATCIPPDNTPRQELYIDCEEQGAINIQLAQYTHRPTSSHHTTATCTYKDEPQDCIHDATSDPDIMSRCMGQTSCTYPISPLPLPLCGKTVVADHFQVKYQCIPEAMETDNIVDVCGDVLNGKNVNRHSGYIESPSYPRHYPPNLQCQCYLSTEADASLQLTVLDMELARDTVNEACNADWLTYSASHSGNWGEGEKLCYKRRGDIIDTQKHEIRLDFKSDLNVEDRGFWIRYTAVREDGLHVGVQVMCGPRHGVTQDGMATRTDNPSSINQGLVIGLSLIACLIIGVLILIIVLRYKRVRKSKLAETMANTTPLEKGRTTFRQYSSTLTEHQPYTNLHNEKKPTSAIRQYIEHHPDYDTRPAANPNPSYVNPAFDGSLDPGPYNATA